jgi:hypothetical protein
MLDAGQNGISYQFIKLVFIFGKGNKGNMLMGGTEAATAEEEKYFTVISHITVATSVAVCCFFVMFNKLPTQSLKFDHNSSH